MIDNSSWLSTNTFHHSNFSNIEELVEKKREKNLKISLCFPTLNEEKTIGKEIIIMASELKDRYPLLDEIAVIDSGSKDKTCEVAKNFGAKVFLASDYLKEEGEQKGKGENLWKSLYLLEGDIIVFIDADISNIHPKFVYGLVGPLLFNEDIKFSKAFYERPISLIKGKSSSGGGRVSEILIRPLFSQFFPELAKIIQPLSGEYAGYRSVFDKLSFPVGYGVETGMLIDIYQEWGLHAIAQTDLDKRVHVNQSTKALGRMSFGIMQTFWSRLAKYKGICQIQPESYSLKQITVLENEATSSEHEIKEFERKPMFENSEYQKKISK